jgi:hypothetical protein
MRSTTELSSQKWRVVCESDGDAGLGRSRNRPVEPGWLYPSRTERGPHTLLTRAGAGPTTYLSSQNVADLEPDGPGLSRTEQELTSTTAGLGWSRTHV